MLELEEARQRLRHVLTLGWRAAGQLEMPGQRRHFSPMSDHEFQDADRDLAEDALRELVAEIAAGDYRARIGLPLTNNTAYLKAVALLQTRDAMQRGDRRRR